MDFKCLRCGHSWVGRKVDGRKPLQCPRCRSNAWDRMKVRDTGPQRVFAFIQPEQPAPELPVAKAPRIAKSRQPRLTRKVPRITKRVPKIR